jgi:outer membrane protein OmpA-like peptidoglycan-associated protein
MPTAAPAIEVATLTLEKARARFVDHTTTPAYAEELEDVNATFTPLTTTPGRRTRFAATGVIAGGSFKLEGEEAYGERPALDLKLEIRNVIVPRANAYLNRHTAWVANSGSLDVTGTYKLDGAQLETRHDVVVRGLDVAAVDDRDEVERRIGLPFGLLVSLLKDSHGEIRLSLPVSGDLNRRDFDYTEAVWSAVRNLSIRLLALPFSKIGSLFFSEDSKVKAVALAPVVFEAGTDRLGPGMEAHLQRVAEFLRGTPAVKAILEPVIIEADVQALKWAGVLEHLAVRGGSTPDGEVLERAKREYRLRWPDRPVPATFDAVVAELVTAETLPADAMQKLGTRRIEAIRQSLARAGGVDAARLPGTAPRTPLVEAAGAPRVEFDLRS